MKNKKYIIGLEAGESGGRALSYILNRLPGSRVGYRSPWNKFRCSGHLPWKKDKIKLDNKIRSLTESGGDIIGDVGNYYLNYIEDLIVRLPNLSIICVYRDKCSNIDALMRKTDYPGSHDHTYPFIPNMMYKRDYIETYYDIYKDAIAALLIYYPKRILLIDVKDLLDQDGYNRVKSFLDV